MVDQLIALVRQIDSSIEPRYNKYYIGLSIDGQPDGFVRFRVRKNSVVLDVKVPQSGEIDAQLAEAGLETLDYSKRYGSYAIRLGKDDIGKHGELISALMRNAFAMRHA